ncbi:MAG: hypothetical protein A2Y24_04345 [Clostridiales bacterium GWE2_32_10]|nr:MAG: hypothetical protein A2Y24_04345 [Clostridiales bacterium GWE2_32_10]
MYRHADHLRAILDILEAGNEQTIRWLKNFRDDFICSEEYDEVFFKKIYELKDKPNWDLIDSLIGYEYKFKWLKWKENKLNG